MHNIIWIVFVGLKYNRENPRHIFAIFFDYHGENKEANQMIPMLIADDNAAIVDILKTFAAPAGFAVTAAGKAIVASRKRRICSVPRRRKRESA